MSLPRARVEMNHQHVRRPRPFGWSRREHRRHRDEHHQPMTSRTPKPSKGLRTQEVSARISRPPLCRGWVAAVRGRACPGVALIYRKPRSRRTATRGQRAHQSEPEPTHYKQKGYRYRYGEVPGRQMLGIFLHPPRARAIVLPSVALDTPKRPKHTVELIP